MYVLSRTSKQRLETCDEDIQRVINLAIKRTCVDFGVAEGHRPVKRQKKLYAQGRTEPGSIVTYVDGVNELSEHNYVPSKGIDIYAWVNGKAVWSGKYMAYLAGVIMSCASELGINLVWGANWDDDGQLYDDQNFIDAPHYQLK